MKKFSKEYIVESLQDTLGGKLGEKYNALKKGILDLLETSIKNPEVLVNVQNFIDGYTKDTEAQVIEGFVEAGDIFNFYLKYQVEIDELCKDYDYFSKSAKDLEVFSLYDFVIVGTKYAVKECMNQMLTELFKG